MPKTECFPKTEYLNEVLFYGITFFNLFQINIINLLRTQYKRALNTLENKSATAKFHLWVAFETWNKVKFPATWTFLHRTAVTDAVNLMHKMDTKV